MENAYYFYIAFFNLNNLYDFRILRKQKGQWANSPNSRQRMIPNKPLKQGENVIPELIKTFVSLIEEKDKFLKGHSETVASNCVRFCTKLGLPKKEVEKSYLAGLLHDIGMVFLPQEIIERPGKITDDEFILVKQHPVIAEKILSNLSLFSNILPIIRYHHERYDGGGYPDHIKGEEIPLVARVLHLVDSWESMVSDRSYREALSREQALQELEKNAGKQFDPTLVKAFVEFIKPQNITSADEAMGQPNEVSEEKEEGESNPIQEIIMAVIQKFKKGEIDLPVLPKVVQEIQQVMSNQNSTAEDVAHAIEKDPVISVRLIAVANSPIYRGTEKIQTVKQAIPRMGLKETQTVVTTIANKNLYKTNNEYFKKLMNKQWLHSLACAYGSRIIAKKLSLSDLEQYFFMGLIHDIGKAPLLKYLTELSSQNGDLNREDIIAGVQDFHSSFGGALLKRWGFGHNYIRVVTQHEKEDNFTFETEKSILVVNLANMMATKVGYGSADDDTIDLTVLKSTQLLKLDIESLADLSEEVVKTMEESANIF